MFGMARSRPPFHPFGPVLLALAAIMIFGMAYFAFGIGKDAPIFAVSVLIAFGMPVVVIFGIEVEAGLAGSLLRTLPVRSFLIARWVSIVASKLLLEHFGKVHPDFRNRSAAI
jgi:hypothetical protein